MDIAESRLRVAVDARWISGAMGRANYGNGDGDFVIPFPNRCAFVLISSDPNDTSYAEISQAFPVNNSKFRVGCATAEGNNVNPANLTCNWYAKGW